MSWNDNLSGYGFHERTAEQQREIARKGGIASGQARRRKADFRKTLNMLLTAEIDSPEWEPLLKSIGLDSTLEAAVNAAMIKAALNGNVKAYEAIARYSGQSDRTEADQEEQRARVAASKAKNGQYEAEDVQDDGFIDALKGSAENDWKDFNVMEEGKEDDAGCGP